MQEEQILLGSIVVDTTELNATKDDPKIVIEAVDNIDLLIVIQDPELTV